MKGCALENGEITKVDGGGGVLVCEVKVGVGLVRLVRLVRKEVCSWVEPGQMMKMSSMYRVIKSGVVL